MSDKSPKSPDREAYQQALAVLAAMARDRPQNPEYRAALAGSYLTLGIRRQKTGRTREAEQSYQRCESTRAMSQSHISKSVGHGGARSCSPTRLQIHVSLVVMQ